MPWTPKQATKHDKKAKTSKAKKIWSSTANAVLKKSGDEGKAIRIANAAVNKNNRKRKK